MHCQFQYIANYNILTWQQIFDKISNNKVKVSKEIQNTENTEKTMMRKIQVHVVKAILTKSSLFESFTSFCVQIKAGQQIKQTSVKKDSNSTPSWNETLQFIYQPQNINETIQISVKNQNSVDFHMIGSTSIKLNNSSKQQDTIPKWYSLLYKEKPAGKIMLSIISSVYQLGYQNIDYPSKIQANGKSKLYFQQEINKDKKITSQVRFNDRIKISSDLSLSNEVFCTGVKGVRKISARKNQTIYPSSSGINFNGLTDRLASFEGIKLRKNIQRININYQQPLNN